MSLLHFFKSKHPCYIVLNILEQQLTADVHSIWNWTVPEYC